MTKFRLRWPALGTGLFTAALVAGSAFAGPKLPTQPTTKFSPDLKVDPSLLVNQGLDKTATVDPRGLFDSGVSMNVHRALRVEATDNRAVMDKNSQLWLYFRAKANTDYDVECKFVGSRSILTMDYASGKFVRQQTAAPIDGKLGHRVYKRTKAEEIKVFMQANGDIDWRSCTVKPRT
jgi:hypothetical protein